MAKKQNPIPKKITFHHIKSDGFRNILATGVVGGVTINSLINMNIFTDRTVIPSEITYEVKDGKLGAEIDRVTKQGVIRDMQVSVLMDISVAKKTAKWLNDQIELLEKLNKK